MANIRTCNKHNMIACVEKTAHNADFYQIIDYLTGCSINYSLLVDPDLIGPWLQQFWATASLRVINEVPHIRATVAGKKVLISEETIRADLLFDDADGVDCFPKQVIWDSLRDIGYEGNLAQLTFSKPLFSPQWKYLVHVLLHCLSPKSTSWEQFGTNIASALVGLATNQKFNFSLMIMNGMLGHIANGTPFLMYPRFIQLFLNKQLEGVTRPQNFLPSVTLPSKVFTFMRKHSPKFSCRITPLTPPMLEVVTALAAEEAHSTSPHSRAASSPRDAQGTPAQSAAQDSSLQGTADLQGTAEEDLSNLGFSSPMSTKPSMVKDFEDLMQKEFKMSSMGELTFFLGLQVKQTTAGIFLSQDKYVKDILNKFDFRTIKPASTPIEARGKDEEGEDVDVHLYRFQVTPKRNKHCAISSTEAEYCLEACQVFDVRDELRHNADFYQIIDYLTGCSINYSLLVNPDLIGPWLQQFWATASLRVINEVPHIRAMVAGKRVLISEETIRADLLFDDADGVDCFPKQVIWDSLRDIGYEALAAEEAHSTSPHSRAASSPRDAQGTPAQSAAQASISQGTADLQDESQTSGGDEGLLDLYALNREVRRLKKQTISQAKQIHKLKAKLKKLSKGVQPVVEHHALWVKSQNLKKQKKRRKKQKKKVSSVKLGRNKDESNLSEEHHDQDDHHHTAFVYEDVDATEAVVTPDLERKSDETEEVLIEEEKDASDVKSGDTEELDLERIQSTARQSTVTPRTLDFDDEAGPSSPIRPTQEEEPEEQFKDDELLADILLNRTRGLSIPGPMQSQPQQPTQATDPKEKGKGILVEEPKKKKLTLQQIRALETKNDEEVARKIQAEWDAEEERKRLEALKKPKTILKKPTSLVQERNQMMSFLKGQGYKNLQKLKYPQMKELYDKVQESIKDSFKEFIPMDSEKEKQMLQERDAKRLLRKRKVTVTEEQPSKKLKLRTRTAILGL
ncbi:ribonuclease H-like domain, reverse transcriptase, RNA-dependent DNA polymerase [Tanacetum coccineum]